MSDDSTPAAPPSILDLRITSGQECGFIVWEATEIIAAFSNASELATWIETRARSHAGLAPAGINDDVVSMPNVVRAKPQQRSVWGTRK